MFDTEKYSAILHYMKAFYEIDIACLTSDN